MHIQTNQVPNKANSVTCAMHRYNNGIQITRGAYIKWLNIENFTSIPRILFLMCCKTYCFATSVHPESSVFNFGCNTKICLTLMFVIGAFYQGHWVGIPV